MPERFVYADNAATTTVSPRVWDAMRPFFTTCFGNPSSIYTPGREAKKHLELAREKAAACLGAEPQEFYFTSGGSEADNWAIKGIARLLAPKGKKHIVTTKIEHHAVLHSCESLEKEGFSVTFLEAHEDGLIRPDELEAALREDTALVSIMFANNEIGTIQPIAKIASICRRHGVFFHTDAVQAVGNVPIDVKALGIDLLSLSGHKLHGPKGIGALYVRKGIKLPNLIDGGAQERGHRAGTENVAGAVGLAAALEEACSTMEERAVRVTALRERLIDGALKIERSHLNGDRVQRLPGNINLCFEGIEGESLLLMLDQKGICASSGSACTSGSLDPSHVLLALGLPHEIAHGSLRLSLSGDTTDADVDYILDCLPPIVERLRSFSPLWEEILSGQVQYTLPYPAAQRAC